MCQSLSWRDTLCGCDTCMQVQLVLGLARVGPKFHMRILKGVYLEEEVEGDVEAVVQQQQVLGFQVAQALLGHQLPTPHLPSQSRGQEQHRWLGWAEQQM